MRQKQVMRTLGAALFFLVTMLWAQIALATHEVQVNDTHSGGLGVVTIPSAGITLTDPEPAFGVFDVHCHSSCDAALGHADPGFPIGHGAAFFVLHGFPLPTTGVDQLALTGGPRPGGSILGELGELEPENPWARTSTGRPPPRFEFPGFVDDTLNGIGNGDSDSLFSTSCGSGGGSCDLFAGGFGSGTIPNCTGGECTDPPAFTDDDDNDFNFDPTLSAGLGGCVGDECTDPPAVTDDDDNDFNFDPTLSPGLGGCVGDECTGQPSTDFSNIKVPPNTTRFNTTLLPPDASPAEQAAHLRLMGGVTDEDLREYLRQDGVSEEKIEEIIKSLPQEGGDHGETGSPLPPGLENIETYLKNNLEGGNWYAHALKTEADHFEKTGEYPERFVKAYKNAVNNFRGTPPSGSTPPPNAGPTYEETDEWDPNEFKLPPPGTTPPASVEFEEPPPGRFDNAFDFLIAGGVILESIGLESPTDAKHLHVEDSKEGRASHKSLMKALVRSGWKNTFSNKNKSNPTNSSSGTGTESQVPPSEPKEKNGKPQGKGNTNVQVPPAPKVDEIHSVIKELSGIVVLS